MITIRLIVPDAKRQELLREVFEQAADLTVIYATPDLDEVFGDSNLGLCAEVIVVDLSLPHASQGLFWAVLHQLYSDSHLMAVIEPATPQASIELALVAGAAWIGQWTDPDGLCALVRAAGRGDNPATINRATPAVATSFNRWAGARCQPEMDEFVLDPGCRRAVIGERLIRLSVTESRIIHRLACEDDKAVSTNELLRAGWRNAPNAPATHGQLRVAIHRLRAKIEIDPQQPRYLATVPNYGYQLYRHQPNPLQRTASIDFPPPIRARKNVTQNVMSTR